MSQRSLVTRLIGTWRSAPGGHDFEVLTLSQDGTGSLKTTTVSKLSSVVQFRWQPVEDESKVEFQITSYDSEPLSLFLFLKPLRVSIQQEEGIQPMELLEFSTPLIPAKPEPGMPQMLEGGSYYFCRKRAM